MALPAISSSAESLYQAYKATIVDAKNSGLARYDVQDIIKSIADKELHDSQGLIKPSYYVIYEYFENIPFSPGLATPETILLAKVASLVIGFLIIAKRPTPEEGDEYGGVCSLPADTAGIAYLAVDSTAKRSGVGTKLMLSAIAKTKELGKRYLTLNYIADSLDLSEKNKANTRREFYNSFTTKFGIPKQEKQNIVSRHLLVHLRYDLKDFNPAEFSV